MFPNIPAPGGDNGPEYSKCARKHLAAKPRKGTAVLFHSIKTTGGWGREASACVCDCEGCHMLRRTQLSWQTAWPCAKQVLGGGPASSRAAKALP